MKQEVPFFQIRWRIFHIRTDSEKIRTDFAACFIGIDLNQ